MLFLHVAYLVREISWRRFAAMRNPCALGSHVAFKVRKGAAKRSEATHLRGATHLPASPRFVVCLCFVVAGMMVMRGFGWWEEE